MPSNDRPAPPRRSGVIVPHPPTRTGRLAAWLIHRSLLTINTTLRYRQGEDPANAVALLRARPVIFAVWHNRLALCLLVYHRYVTAARPGRRLAAMVSASRDGGLLTRILELFDVQPVRGSSSRRGPQALLEMNSWAGRGCDLAITPDGPRGPRYRLQPGLINVAAVTGLPIIAASINLGWKKQLPTWDRFQVPLPGSTVTVAFTAPLEVPRQASDAEQERLRQELEQRLLAITRD